MSESKYTKEMARKVRDIPKPDKAKRLVTSVVEHPDYLELVVWENQIMEMDSDLRGHVFQYLLKCRDMIQSYGIRCELGGRVGDPPL
jgi:hypothetical protein